MIVDQVSSTSETVGFIIQIQELKRNVDSWGKKVTSFGTAQELLRRSRFQFPQDWLYYDVIESEWNSFNEILNRKSESLESQIPLLQKKILEEEEAVAKRISQTVDEWDKVKPMSGAVEFKHALSLCSNFETRVVKLDGELTKLMQAKEALALPPKPVMNKLPVVKEEVESLQEVWTHLSGVCLALDELAETPWAAINPKKIRRTLESLVEEKLNTFPPKLRNYDAFVFIQSKIKSYQNHNGNLIYNHLLNLLKSFFKTIF